MTVQAKVKKVVDSVEPGTARKTYRALPGSTHKQAPTAQTIHKFVLKNGPLTVREISERMKINRHTVEGALVWLRRGHLVRPEVIRRARAVRRAA